MRPSSPGKRGQFSSRKANSAVSLGLGLSFSGSDKTYCACCCGRKPFVGWVETMTAISIEKVTTDQQTRLPVSLVLKCGYIGVSLNFLKPTLIRIPNFPFSPPPTRGSGKEGLIGQRMMWIHLQIVFWDEFNLYCQDTSNLLYMNQQQ